MRALVLFSLILMTACAHAPRESAPGLRPLAPIEAISPRNASQVIHAAFGDRAVTLRTALEVDASSVKVVGVTATGQRLFTAAWDGHNVTADRGPFVPDDLDPQRVLADMQLALWPLPALRGALSGDSAYEITEPFAG